MEESASSSTTTPETVRAADVHYDVVEKASRRMMDKRKVAAAAAAAVHVHRKAHKRRSSEPNIRLPKATHFALKTIEPFSPALLTVRAATENLLVSHSAPGENTPLVNSSQYLGSDEPPNLHFDDRPPGVSVCQRIGKGYQAYKGWTLRTSRSACIMFPVYSALMVFSCHACFMGFHSECKWLVSLPEVYVIMGLSSFFVELSRSITVLHKTCGPYARMCSLLERGNAITFGIGTALFSLSYLLELLMFFLKTTVPSTTFGSDTYCDPGFYKYVKCTNWILPVLIFFMAVAHGPHRAR